MSSHHCGALAETIGPFWNREAAIEGLRPYRDATRVREVLVVDSLGDFVHEEEDPLHHGPIWYPVKILLKGPLPHAVKPGVCRVADKIFQDVGIVGTAPILPSGRERRPGASCGYKIRRGPLGWAKPPEDNRPPDNSSLFGRLTFQ